MAKKAVSANERMNRELLAALRAGQIMRGDSDLDTAKIMPNCKSIYYQRKRDPERFTIRDLRIQAQRYHFTDCQLCKIIGVEYRGGRTL